jgi:hypothetical protein
MVLQETRSDINFERRISSWVYTIDTSECIWLGHGLVIPTTIIAVCIPIQVIRMKVIRCHSHTNGTLGFVYSALSLGHGRKGKGGKDLGGDFSPFLCWLYGKRMFGHHSKVSLFYPGVDESATGTDSM